MKYIKNFKMFESLNEGINYDGDCTDQEKDLIQTECLEHIAKQVEEGFTSGYLDGEDPSYRGEWNINYDGDCTDQEKDLIETECLEHIAKQVEEGFISGYLDGEEPSYRGQWNITISSEYENDETILSEISKRIKDSIFISYDPNYILEIDITIE